MTEREMMRRKAAARKARKERERKARNRRVALTICLMVAICVISIGGTIAWLTDTTGEIKNTFTASDINITLEESDDLDLKMVPGKTIIKDPLVTVHAGSEACYLFVKLTKSANYSTYLADYEMASGWNALDATNHPGVYYREVDANEDDDQEFQVLKEDKLTVLTSVTKAQMGEIMDKNQPTLTFKAAAVQKENLSLEDAWTEAAPLLG